jgi:hypothetical protein
MQYILEYGVEAGQYTEKRTINGGLSTFTLRDLLNGVTYEVKLTPVTITGERLDDLAAIGRGTPNGAGFHLGPSDPVIDIETPDLHGGAPLIEQVPPDHTPQTGMPLVAWIVAVIIACGFFLRYRMKRSERLSRGFLEQMDQYYKSRS